MTGDSTECHESETPGESVPGESAAPRGSDLARAALEAARARNAAARGASGRGRSGRTARSTDGDNVRRLRRRRWSGPGEDTARDPQLIGDTLRSWLARTDTGGEVTRARLFAQWAQIVGPEIADHARPQTLIDGELTIEAVSTAWATQLRLLAPGVVKRINQALGHGTVTVIRTKGPTAPSWRFGNRHVPGRGPRDTYG